MLKCLTFSIKSNLSVMVSLRLGQDMGQGIQEWTK